MFTEDPDKVPLKNISSNVDSSRLADINTPLLYNHWYVAAYSHGISRQLTEKTILNRSIVLYRTEAGQVVALQNRCAHRSYPLSKGWLKGDSIQCRYHGATYNCKGEMTGFPCQERIPKVSLHQYPVKEIGPLVWIWMGDVSKADENNIVDTEFLTSEQWQWVTGSMKLEGNYILMQENLMDLSHLPYLHMNTFHVPKKVSAVPLEVEINGNEVNFWREMSFPGHFPTYMKAHTRTWLNKSGGTFLSPGVFLGWGDAEMLDAKPQEQRMYSQRVPHLLTPETETSTHYWYFSARNYCLNDEEVSSQFERIINEGFMEDKECINDLQNMWDIDKTPYREISFRSDKAAIAMRRKLKELAKAEYQN